MTNKRLNNPELVRFIKKYGREAIQYTRTQLDNRLDWFLATKRMLITREKGQNNILGLITFFILDELKVSPHVWPKDNPKGEYVLIDFIVLHPKARNRGLMKKMLKLGKKLFPQVKFIIFMRRKHHWQLKVYKINTFLKEAI